MQKYFSEMFRLTLIAYLAVAALAAPNKSNKPASRKNLFPSGRIVGGSPVSPGEYPWQASIQVLGSHICGGTVISENFVITAGHCSDYPASWYTVVAGITNLNENGQSSDVAEITVHPDYDTLSSGIPINDIAVYRLRSPFTLNSNLQPAELPSAGQEIQAGTEVTITGWGSTREGGDVSDDLLQVQVPVVSADECDDDYSQFGGVPAGQICAGVPQGGKDSCQGDSGGPLTEDGVLVGVVSWGNGCAEAGYPGVYTDVAYFIDFVNSVIG